MKTESEIRKACEDCLKASVIWREGHKCFLLACDIHIAPAKSQAEIQAKEDDLFEQERTLEERAAVLCPLGIEADPRNDARGQFVSNYFPCDASEEDRGCMFHSFALWVLGEKALPPTSYKSAPTA